MSFVSGVGNKGVLVLTRASWFCRLRYYSSLELEGESPLHSTHLPRESGDFQQVWVTASHARRNRLPHSPPKWTLSPTVLGGFQESPQDNYSGCTLISEIKSSALGDFKNSPKVITRGTPRNRPVQIPVLCHYNHQSPLLVIDQPTIHSTPKSTGSNQNTRTKVGKSVTLIATDISN